MTHTQLNFTLLFRYNKNGQLAIAGFSDPMHDPKDEDIKLWVPDSPPPELDLQISRFLLAQVADQFCDLWQQEQQAIKEHMNDGKLSNSFVGIHKTLETNFTLISNSR